MNSFQKFMAAILLALVLVGPVFAGDMNEPPAPDPSPTPSAQAAIGDCESPVFNATGDSATPSEAGEDPTMFMFDLLYSVMFIY